MGSYHFSELPLIMGTHGDYRGSSTAFETELSNTMQDLWLAFAKDPNGGLTSSSWTPYSSNGTALVLGRDDTLVQNEPVVNLDGACSAP
jgi:acetylcholinesterase